MTTTSQKIVTIYPTQNLWKHRPCHGFSSSLLQHFFNISSIIIEEMLKKSRQYVINQPMLGHGGLSANLSVTCQMARLLQNSNRNVRISPMFGYHC